MSISRCGLATRPGLGRLDTYTSEYQVLPVFTPSLPVCLSYALRHSQILPPMSLFRDQIYPARVCKYLDPSCPAMDTVFGQHLQVLDKLRLVFLSCSPPPSLATNALASCFRPALPYPHIAGCLQQLSTQTSRVPQSRRIHYRRNHLTTFPVYLRHPEFCIQINHSFNQGLQGTQLQTLLVQRLADTARVQYSPCLMVKAVVELGPYDYN